jgi:deoxyribose-phosphate aldolase
MIDIDSIVKEVSREVYNNLAGKGESLSGASDEYSPASMAKYVDHTILAANSSKDAVQKVCDEARKYKFASVCVNGYNTKFVAQQLEGSGVKTCTVVGFPLGAMSPKAKAEETSLVIIDGATEVDMVVNIGAIKSGDWKLVFDDIEGVVRAARGKAIVKVIIETCLLTDEEKVKACAVSKLAGADFVKTSTGFSTGGATEDDVSLMRKTVGPDLGVKASGGVRSYEDAVKMIKAGATRLGTSSGVAIVSGPSESASSHKCVNCGNCKNSCPAGRTEIIKDKY